MEKIRTAIRRTVGNTMANSIIPVVMCAEATLFDLGLYIQKRNPFWIHLQLFFQIKPLKNI